jgi:hypothetical protein
MAASDRGSRFNELVGEEMTLAISASGKSARSIAREMQIDPTSLFRYTSAKVAIPVHVTIDVCERIGASPQDLAERAYLRLIDELGVPS